MIYGVNTNFGKKMDMLEMAINATNVRREVIADNIANADTPFFKRSDVTFEAQLERAVESEKEPEFPAILTDPAHIAFDEPWIIGQSNRKSMLNMILITEMIKIMLILIKK